MLNGAVGALGLSIGLRMISGGEGEVRTEGGVKRLPKVTREARVAIRDDGLGETMEFEDVGDEE